MVGPFLHSGKWKLPQSEVLGKLENEIYQLKMKNNNSSELGHVESGNLIYSEFFWDKSKLRA